MFHDEVKKAREKGLIKFYRCSRGHLYCEISRLFMPRDRKELDYPHNFLIIFLPSLLLIVVHIVRVHVDNKFHDSKVCSSSLGKDADIGFALVYRVLVHAVNKLMLAEPLR